MARMIPAEFIEGDTESKAEQELFPLLQKSFDDSWTIFHSFTMVAKNLQKQLIDAEIDFLFFHHEKGILVMEVKGGIISYKDGKWYQYTKPINPLQQAKLNKYNIKDFIKERMNADPQIKTAHAACFPDCYSDIPNLPPECTEITLTGKDMPYIENAVERILAMTKDERSKPLSEALGHAVIKNLMPAFEIGSSIIDRIGQSERKIFSLTEQQCNLLDFISGHNQVLVEGCAGSGKTIMAVKKARQLAVEGKKVLLMCYNNMLGKHLVSAASDLDNITAGTYHDFCFNVLEDSGMDINPDGKAHTFWTEDVPAMFAKYIEENPLKFDAIIVDEGQDFREDYWISIQDLMKDKGYFYIFYDPEQNLFETLMRLPELGRPFTLRTNCRNSKSIFKALKPYANQDIKIMDAAPEGENIHEFASENEKLRRNELSRILHELIVDQGVNEENIVIIGGHGMHHTCLKDNPQTGQFRIVENGPAAEKQIPYYTYMKYKGCESDVVILLDVDDKDKRWNRDGAMYTAMSRAKHLLYLIKK